jgi:hypothetical protein
MSPYACLHAFSHFFGLHLSALQHLHAVSVQVHAPPVQHAQSSGQHAAGAAIGHVCAGALSLENAGGLTSANMSSDNVERMIAVRVMSQTPFDGGFSAGRVPRRRRRISA